jgi:hypothetical protein
MRLDARDTVRFSALSSPAEILAGAANPYHAARPRRVSAAGLRPTQAKLVTRFQSVARGRIRRFESYHPSHAVGLSASLLVSAGGAFRPAMPDRLSTILRVSFADSLHWRSPREVRGSVCGCLICAD